MDETETDPQEKKERRSFWNHQLPLERETCIFILVNALDVFMTYLLLVTGNFRDCPDRSTEKNVNGAQSAEFRFADSRRSGHLQFCPFYAFGLSV